VSATIRRATRDDAAAAWAIVDEYNHAVDVIARDDAATFAAYLDGPGALWLALAGDEVVGCVALRPLPQRTPPECEVKRLYVRPHHRGAGIAGALMETLEAYSREAGFSAILLDTYDALAAALRFYEGRGYERIERYNQNPQATIFMRRRLGSAAR
jgi:ribosomal protein S18 acetylase RimI-like enzyme